MSGGRKSIHISHSASDSTITVTLPLTERSDFPSVTRFTMGSKGVDVRVIRAESDKIGFVLTLNTNMPQECRRQLDRIFAPRNARAIVTVRKGDARTIQVTSAAITKAVCALRQIAKFPQQSRDGSSSSVPITEEAVGPNVIQRRNTLKILTGLADENGRIPATRLPRPDPRNFIDIR